MRTSMLARIVGLGLATVVVGCTQGSQPVDNPSAANRPAAPPAKESSAETPAPEPHGGRYDVKVASAEGRLPSPAAVDPAEPGRLGGQTALPLDEVAGKDLVMPQVYLSQAHAQLCRVGVGDPFPDLELADLEGRQQSVSRLLGKRLTVVVFWNGQRPLALEELKDMESVEKRFSPQGVAVIGINSGDSPKLAAELAGHAEVTFVNLVDPTGTALAQVGTGKIPRTYLVDATGKIVWFDIEYSRTTRRSLSQAIGYMLTQP